MKQNDAMIRIVKIMRQTQNIILVANEITELCHRYRLPPLSFEERMQIAWENLDLICITEDQKAVIDELSHEIARIVKFEDLVIQECLYQAIKEWQIKNSRPILLITQIDKSEQLKVGIEVLKRVIKKLEKLIYKPDNILKKKFLDDVFAKSCEIYKELLTALSVITNPKNEEAILEFQIDNWLDETNTIFEEKDKQPTPRETDN